MRTLFGKNSVAPGLQAGGGFRRTVGGIAARSVHAALRRHGAAHHRGQGSDARRAGTDGSPRYAFAIWPLRSARPLRRGVGPDRDAANWHPYPPCNWVKTQQYGWYYDDKTPWGQIVHHYGRWFCDQQLGWAWDPGSEFSPGWVVWRTSPEWVGWAPMPPDQSFQNVSSDAFNNSDQWIFVETAKFNNGCELSQVAPVERVPVLLRQTKWVTAVEYVDGIVVIVLPPLRGRSHRHHRHRILIHGHPGTWSRS